MGRYAHNLENPKAFVRKPMKFSCMLRMNILDHSEVVQVYLYSLIFMMFSGWIFSLATGSFPFIQFISHSI